MSGIRVEQKRLQVELVERVEEVGAHVDLCPFAQVFQVRKPKRFGQTQVGPPVARAAEGVAPDRGRERVREG